MKTKFILFLLASLLLSCEADPDDLNYETNFVKGMKLSAERDKPILLYFAGQGCVNADDRMFHNTYAKSKSVQDLLNDEFVMIQLYVNDRADIQVSDTLGLHSLGIISKDNERFKKVKTVGGLNAIIEKELFEQFSQPLYVIMDAKRDVLLEPFGYINEDSGKFIERLNQGLLEFKRRK